MMIDAADYRRLARYFAGECTDEERRETEAWLADDPERRAEADRLRAAWDAGVQPLWIPNMNSAWTRMAARMRVGESQAPLTLVRPARTSGQHKFHWDTKPARRARTSALTGVGALAAAVITTVVLRNAPLQSGAPAPGASTETADRNFKTSRGQRAVIVLGDGSRVELGAESVLRVHTSAGQRTVSLEGQAVFDVVHDSLQPFEVRAANAITEDLGTRFMIRAYRGESSVRVFVASGKVALRAIGSPASSGTLLGPNDLGVLDSVGRTTVRNDVDSTSHLAWTRDRFVFDNAPLSNVLADIARWFDVRIEVASPELGRHRITMNVPARSLADVLGAVTTPLRLRSVKRGSTIVIQ